MTNSSPSLALIGLGAIGRVVADRLLATPEGARLTSVLVRPAQVAAARATLPDSVAVVSSVAEMRAHRPDMVIEAAGQQAVHAYGREVLEAGCKLVLVSSGALADAALHDALLDAAARNGGKLVIAPGAMAGLDGLGALKRAGLTEVLYTSTKPPAAWRGTPAEQAVDLMALTQAHVFFEGSAREAALAYPKNANIAATIALAGLGFDATRVRLVADPAAAGNSGKMEADSVVGRLEVRMGGAASANPKTSASTAFSLLKLIDDATAPLVV